LKEWGQFNNGGGGAGKSHLIKAIYHTVTKTFRHGPMNPELPSVFVHETIKLSIKKRLKTAIKTLYFTNPCSNHPETLSWLRP
jgi:chromosomal replication initiation ATPase DnaA